MTPSATSTISIDRNPSAAAAERREEILRDPGFGRYFTDHMFLLDWSSEDGWTDARIVPYGPLQLDPASAVLHYGQEIFEGLKAYRHPDGGIKIFRPDRNAARLRRSAARLQLPELPTEWFVESLRALVSIDQEWVPDGDNGYSLYLRPFIFGTDTYLGVRPPETALYMVIASPVAPILSRDLNAVDVWVSDLYSRAALGGTGEAKCGGNYAAGLGPAAEAKANGCSQTLFLDAETRTYVDELGGMNVMLITADGRLLTPALTGSILHGVTRESLLVLAEEELGLKVEERRIGIDEWRDGVADGTITEIFACGTAAVVNPIAAVKGNTVNIPAAKDTGGPVTRALHKALTDIQYGRVEDKRGWLVRLDA